MTNPVQQIVGWTVELLNKLVVAHWGLVQVAGAAAIVSVLVYWTYRRLRGGDTDPNLSLTHSTDAGSTSLLISGVDAVALLVAGLALLTWEMLVNNYAYAVMLVLVVAVHWIVEKRERAGGVTSAVPIVGDDDD